MNEKIEELKRLIATLEENSPLRAQLEAALQEEEARLAEAQAATQEQPTDQEQPAEEPKDEAPRQEAPGNAVEELIDKIDDLMQDDEFVSGLAGFLLGAATIGLGALAMSSIRKG